MAYKNIPQWKSPSGKPWGGPAPGAEYSTGAHSCHYLLNQNCVDKVERIAKAKKITKSAAVALMIGKFGE